MAPTYDYICQKCEHEFEAIQKITEEPLTDCPECGSNKAKRCISASTFVLKGGGWYSDGYASSNKKD